MRFLQFLIFGFLGFVASVAQAAITFELQAFNAADMQTTAFGIGDAVTIRVVGIDTAGAGVDFTSNDMFSFQTSVNASTMDANGSIVSYPVFGGTSTSPGGSAPFTATGTVLSRSENNGNTPVPLSGTSVVLGEFSYTFANDTTFDFTPGFTSEFSYSTPFPANMTPSLGGPLNVTAVPEPASCAAFMVVGACAGIRRYRRRKAC